MLSYERNKAILLLDDYTVFEGIQSGKRGMVCGEICFNTGMTGYEEIFTDPSYYKQIVVMTNVHIGNYGVYEKERESNRTKIAGLVSKNLSNYYSRANSKESLQDFLETSNVVGIQKIDTRSLVEHIRDKGAMNAIISSENTDVEYLKLELKKVPNMKGLELSSRVTTKESYSLGDENSDYRVGVLDLGVKQNILRCLLQRGCYIKVFPCFSKLEEIMSFNPNGIMLSNGPGDPQSMPNQVKLVRDLLSLNIPMFGICLGHQLLALACGLRTYKMFNGHRGCNHPVINLLTNKGEITSQNHGFVVDSEGIENNPEIEVTHRHLNDDTIAGIRLKNKPVFSVQYHPESAPGPKDSRYLFDDFVKLIQDSKTLIKG